MNNSRYFIEKYVKIIHVDRGLINCELYPYQHDMIDMLNDNRFNIILACRQSGKTIGIITWLLWYALFHPDQTIAILANKGDTARMIMRRIMLALENIPFFLQAGAKEYNKSTIIFENNTQLIARPTSDDSIRGISATVVYMDEFAFVENAEEFYTSTYPTISSGKTTRVIITSTANGIGNPFHTIYQNALKGRNKFAHMRVDWQDVPERDEIWKQNTIANMGQRQFDQEFGNSFVGSGNTLIDSNTLLGLSPMEPIRREQDGCMLIYEERVDDHEYVLTVDTSKGRGQDYSAFCVIDVTTTPWRQVVTYRNNVISPLLYPSIVWRCAQVYNDAYVMVENNEVGQTVAETLWHDIEYENMYVSTTLKTRKGERSNIGLNMNRLTKHVGCSHLKDILEEGKLMVIDAETIRELSSFVAKGVGWEADRGCHDDLVMCLVMFAWFADSTIFNEAANTELRTVLYENRMREIDDDMLPDIVIDDPAEIAEVQRKYENIDIDVPDNFIRYDDWLETPFV